MMRNIAAWIVLDDVLDQASYDGGRFLQSVESRLQANLADSGCDDRYIGGATVAEVTNQDAAAAGEGFSVQQVVSVTFGAPTVSVN